ncbi:MAG TPA: radical SAM family heme chaperone HemW [Verrucomicrobiae bacterium]|jgi:oxygen-independent coproporphyrinogen-3 oxidase|nr:radical SAM family heme chaperone HemW [Verrucomicrobiae bacterium]
MLESFASPVSSLYVHVPFCAQKCNYCAFYSEASNGELIERYVQSLIRELELVASDLRPRTIFFGGGTPSLLNLRQWQQILETMHRIGLSGAAEWTVECNPATVSLDKAKLLREHGVNRISMGVQSLNEALLDRLGRIHSREMVFKSFDILRAAGFDNVNLDLMFAIPGQTLDIWRETLREATALGSEHLSSYEVIYEDDTPLYAQLKAGEFDVDEDLACAMYEELISHATQVGFQQYEIANFAQNNVSSINANKFSIASKNPIPNSALRIPHSALPNRACQHNVNYWRGGSFYGLGPSASGYVRGIRTKNVPNTQRYCEQLEQGKRAIETSEELSPRARAGEIAAFGLRMNIGWPFEQFQNVTGWDLRREWSGEIQQLESRGWARSDSERFQLTSAGLRFADSAAELFLR